MDTNTFIYTMYIASTPQKLWDAITMGEFTKQYWSGREIRSDWKVGSPVLLAVSETGATDWHGTVLKCEPPRVLSFTFKFEENKALSGEPFSKVTYEISKSGSGVRFTVTHEGLTQAVYNDVSQGWPEILSSLKTLLETGKPLDEYGH
jgi:uncharacterized protein YndB with AHSA1/START domain